MAKHNIKTHSTETFRSSYIKPEPDGLLKPGFGQFFTVKVEELLSLIKLPVPPTRSTTHSFIYLTSGEANMTIGSQSYTIFKDECLVVPAGQVYAFAKHDVNKGYLCNFHNDFIIGKFGQNELINSFEFLHAWGNPRITLNRQTSDFVLQILKRILVAYSKNGLENSAIIRSYFIAMLCEINSVYKPLLVAGPATSVRLTNTFKELLVKHLKTKHRVSDYAALLHVSPNHLNKSIKNSTGRSPIKWIDEAIVLEAKVLLCQTHLSVNEIASELGIHDPSYFSRLFKKHEKLTPLQFRKKIEMS